MNNKLKLISYYFKLFVLSLLMFLLITISIINNTYLNEKYHLNKMDSKYYNKLSQEIHDSIKLNTMASNFDEEIIDDFYTTSDIKEDVKEYMDYIFNKSNNKLDLTNVEAKVTARVNKYLNDNNITDSEGISTYIKTVLDIYEEKITVMHITDLLRNRLVKIHKMFNILIIVLLLVIILFMIIIRKNIKLYLFIPLNVTSILFIIISILLFKNIDITHLMVITYSISEYVRILLNSTIRFLILFGSITLLISIIINLILVLKNQNSWDILEKNS